MKTQVFVGLDVSKQKLDVAVRPQGRHFVTPNNDRGIKQLVKRLAAINLNSLSWRPPAATSF
jgi:transposase